MNCCSVPNGDTTRNDKNLEMKGNLGVARATQAQSIVFTMGTWMKASRNQNDGQWERTARRGKF